MRLIDTHCHLNADRFEADIDTVIAAAQGVGVERILVPGWNVASSERAVGLGARVPWLDVAVGIHPHDAAKVDPGGWQRIVEMAASIDVVAIGETGLDYDRVFSPIPDQLDNLRRNLRLAVERDLPVILHCRSSAGRHDAQDALVTELRGMGASSPRPVVHSFSGPPGYADAMLDLGAMISFSGLVFRTGEEDSSRVAARTPRDRVLIETDSPFLAPPGAPRSRNAPEWVRVTGAWLAERQGTTLDELGPQLVDNHDRTFHRDRRPA